jgi:hypothetical protein
MGLTVPQEEAQANLVPAAAVIRGGRALPGITGFKGGVGGPESQVCNPTAQRLGCT